MASAPSGSGWSALQSVASCGPVSSCPPPDAHSSLQAESKEKNEATIELNHTLHGKLLIKHQNVK